MCVSKTLFIKTSSGGGRLDSQAGVCSEEGFSPRMVVTDYPVWGFPSSSDIKESVCSGGDLGSIPGLGRSPGEGNDYHSSIPVWRISWTEEPGRL